MSIDFSTLAVGDIVAERSFTLTRDSLVRYAGASGDFNPIHYRDDVAVSVGLDSVLSHGMLTMGLAVQPVLDWIGDPALVDDYQVRFTRPVFVHPETGAAVEVTAKVGQLDAATGTARLDLTVTGNGQTVLGKAQVRVHSAVAAGAAPGDGAATAPGAVAVSGAAPAAATA